MDEPKDAKQPIVLIVDDSPTNIQVIGKILRNSECEVAIATNGQQCVDMAMEIIPDLILLDIMMPVMDGLEACKILKSSPLTQDIPVIFLTAKDRSEDILKGFQLGAVDYVKKPFSSQELLARVNTHLKLRRTIQDLEKAIKEIKTLSGLLPICANCKSVRDDEGYWQSVESYIAVRSEAKFTHSICPDCMKELYPDFTRFLMKVQVILKPKDYFSCYPFSFR